MDSKYKEYAENAVHKAMQSGAAMAEAYISNSKELDIEVRNGTVETMKLAEDRGMGIRVFQDGKTGFAFTTDLGDVAVDGAVRQALANARFAEPDLHRLLPQPAPSYPDMDLYDPAIRAAAVEEKIDMARTMENEARAADARVSIIESSTYQDGEAEVTLVNSHGLSLHYGGAYCGMYITLVAGEGEDSQTGFAMNFSLRYADLDPAALGKQAAGRAVRMLGARPGATRQAAVVLEPYVATGFLGLLAPALSAEAVQKGRSLFAGKVGQQVASEQINIIDDGTLPGGIASAPFDGEGVPTSRTVLVQNGKLQCFLHNIYTAAKDGVLSTGNGVRGSFKGTPEVGTTNFFIEPGDKTAEQIIGDISSGLYVTEVMGLHTANPISGDFSLGASGLWIENGKLAYPVRGLAIAGNIMEMLGQVDAVGSDLQFFGGRGAPTIRVSRMSISGGGQA
ncbi:TldD/PmbA family protein [Desulfoscipio gibsoniae]|uniref:Putative Zn-dependent protease-like protein n=1 Tax=Desulfoscipio gibsoniae DSM 7213 TaxID=767817 RepID=R4KNC9_9FIRM|nr:TldD/PmbA family protein [Desulfoscipio gibsoniae]AGL02035.1 putative Zn-dependent protease-like protein [Desulfoscipio gibsoniae DSM 7213]